MSQLLAVRGYICYSYFTVLHMVSSSKPLSIQQKQMLSPTGSQMGGLTQPPTASPDGQPPPGFKMSYALAYVPIYVPENGEKGEKNE